MRHFLRFNNFICLLAFSIFTITACQKKADPVPEDTTGSFDGTITPAGSISYITPTYQGSTGSTSGGGPDPTGYFKVNGLTAGNYVLVFTPAAGYTAPAPQVVTITAKGTTSLGTIKVNATPPVNTAVSYPLQGTVNWTSTSNSLTSTGGTYANAPASGSLTLYNGVPTGITIKATGQSGAIAETVELYLPRYTSPALYQLDYSAGTNYATYLRTSGGVVTDAYNTKVLAPVGTVTVTEHNLTARTIRGTFGYTGYDTKGALKVTVSTGSFSLSY